ncbi:MAG: type VI secretion system tip protein VgrG [Rhodocyclaceae bacterium]|nr:type VI secretion system tip protein VgrG [Rhodocyclaceae bacterium]
MADRGYKLISPLGESDQGLLFYRMRAVEGLSQISRFELECLSKNKSISPDDILAQNVHVELTMPDESKRHFAGYVTRFAHVGIHGDFQVYRAMVNPWMWFLTRTADCRIFQEMTVPDIVKQVFGDHPTADFEDRLTASYTPREYCVQYRETDFNFVSRLLEEEGIYYYFEHDGNQNKLILADSMSAHSPFPDYASVEFMQPSNVGRYEDKECISRWTFEREVRPGTWTHTDYDFKKPSVNLKTTSQIPRSHPHADYEVFDYPGEYLEKSDGDAYAKTRIEETQRSFDVAEGVTNARGIAAGFLMTLEKHPRGDQNAEYLITRIELNCQMEGYESDGQGGATFECRFSALKSEHVFRPERRTPRPVVKGPQTAVVVGPAGDHRDLHRRVRPREGPVLLGPLWHQRREQLLLDAGQLPLGRQELGRDPHSPDRPGGDRRMPRGGSRQADHHWPCVQRQPDAALRPAGQQDPVGDQDALVERGGHGELQRDPFRGQEGFRAALCPCRAQHGHHGRGGRDAHRGP